MVKQREVLICHEYHTMKSNYTLHLLKYSKKNVKFIMINITIKYNKIKLLLLFLDE